MIARLFIAGSCSHSSTGTAEDVKHSAVPTGLKNPFPDPTDKSVGYFHLSLRDKTQICKKTEMIPLELLVLG